MEGTLTKKCQHDWKNQHFGFCIKCGKPRPKRKAAVRDLVRIKSGNPKRIGQLARVVAVNSLPRDRDRWRSSRSYYGYRKEKSTYLQYVIQLEGETTLLKVSPGHFDVVRRA